MPKRSNEFQKLIFLFKQQVSENSVVTESKMLSDRDTGTKREVDICIESSISNHKILISIECTDSHRPANITWVEQQKSKHERLPTNMLVLISKSGFTPEALKIAKKYGIETLNLIEVNEESVNQILGKINSLWAKTWNLIPERIILKVVQIPDSSTRRIAVFPDNKLYTTDGKEVGYARDLVNALLRNETLIKEFGKQGNETHKGFEFGCDLPLDKRGNPLLYLQKLEPKILQPIISIIVKGTCTFNVSEFPLKRGKLGNHQIAWSKGVFLGRKALLVASEDEKNYRKFTISTSGLKIKSK